MHCLESSTCGISSLYIYINEWLGMTPVSLDIHRVTHIITLYHIPLTLWPQPAYPVVVTRF